MPGRRAPAGGRGAGARVLQRFHPIVRKWFRETLGTPSVPQREGWPVIACGDHTLILAPTGTGKTLTAFLWELNALITEGQRAPLANAVHILYVSPLKALNNDIQRNLERPLAELRERFAAAGEPFPEIRVAVRTGDTPASARARMLRKAPHILITTPESLHILLTSLRGRGMFSGVRAVIVDEIHAVAGTKRGAHLALTLERLERVTERPPQRIGLSATQKPLEEIAKFLGGLEETPRDEGRGTRDESGAAGRAARGGVTASEGTTRHESAPDLERSNASRVARPAPRESTAAFRPVRIVDCGLVKTLELSVRSPVEDLGHIGGTIWPAVTPLVLEQIRRASTSIIFVNNRGQAERMAARVNALAGEELALPYHGSLSRERRFALESALKAGTVRALVSTSALELGIDIGSVDLVLQLQSPKRVGTALQRVGRAGHSLDAVSRGVFVPTFRDDAMEMLAIVRGMRDGDVEPTRVVQNALDVLAQIIVAAVAVDDWTSEELFALVRRAYPYHALGRAAFDEVLAMLAGKYPSDVAAELQPRLTWDRGTDRLAPARAARLLSVTSGGTIPDRGYYTVTLADRTRLGELDEEFVHETRIGDVFQLGSSTWRVGAIEHDRVIVTPAPGAPARMPFWHGEFAARSVHLASRVGELRRELAAASTRDAVQAIAARYEADESTSQSLVEYVHEQRAATRRVPDERAIVAEHFRDETGAVRIVIHAPFGARVNAPWGMALASLVRERLTVASHDTQSGHLLDPRPSTLAPEIQVQTTDDGIMLRLSNLAGDPPMEILRQLDAGEAERRVLEEVGASALFGARFRMNAARALLLPRGNPRRRMPLWLQRLKAQDLLEVVREFPSFPILVETYRDVLQDAFDMPALASVLRALRAGAIEWSSVATEVPSPFAASLQFGFVMDWMYADDTPRAERRAALLSLDRALLDELMGAEGADAGTLAVLDELLARRRGTAAASAARNADELALLLDRAGDLTLAELQARVVSAEQGRRGDPVAELLESARAVGVDVPTGTGAVEPRFVLADSAPRYAAAFGPERDPAARAAARRDILARFVALAGPVAVEDVTARYAFEPAEVRERLDAWTRAGKLVRGTFGGRRDAMRWCSRRLLEQARRRELAAARRQIQPVELPAFVAFLQRWQHLAPDSRLQGAEGTVAAVRQLTGIARPAESWESAYLRSRVDGYDPDAITRLCATGELVWIGAPPRDAATADALASLRFVRRGAARAWLADVPALSLGDGARATLAALEREGASWLDDLLAATGLGARALRDALRELAAAGIVTNDTMESLRQLLRWRPLVPPALRQQPDPTRWLPADFTPSASRPVVQRRPNLRRLPRWKRPDREGGMPEPWPGRWSLARARGVLGPESDEATLAAEVAHQWLARYGVVARDWWRRERPAVSWRAIYQELKRMEFRGEVRRGYFVRGLAGAQFAAPDAVEALRAHGSEAPIVMAASDPANAYALPLAPDATRASAPRARGRSALLVTRGGAIVLTAERRGRSVRIAPGATRDDVVAAASALARWLAGSAAGGRDVVLESIDAAPAATSPRAEAFLAAGFRRTTAGLRWYATR